jgi:beta-alanine degradation protein BauB
MVSKWMIPFMCAALSVVIADEPKRTHRELQFENEFVKVWKTTIMPHQPLALHRHDRPRVMVGLKGHSLTRIEETGERSELLCEAGKAYWYPADLPGLHGDINETDEPVEVMLIEIKQN